MMNIDKKKMGLIKIGGVLVVVLMSVFGLIHGTGLTVDKPINSDGYGYYAYLPALLIDGNLKISDPKGYDPSFELLPYPSMTRVVNQDWYVIKYPPGVAIMAAPMFGLAWVVAQLGGGVVGGYEMVFQVLVGLGASVYAGLGLMLCGWYYRKEVTGRAAWVSVGIMMLATNLVTYTGYSPLMSHAYAFFLMASLMVLTDRWWKKATIGSSMALGAVLGLLVMVRAVHAVGLIYVLMYGWRWGQRVGQFLTKSRLINLGVVMLGMIVSLSPQLIYHYSLTGEWWYFGYQGEGFNWLDPAWYGVLLSPRSGVLFWSPVWWLTVIGVWRSWGRPWWWAVAVVMSVQVYVIASWGQWWYGDSYGHRAFIDLYPLMGLWLAYAIDWLRQRKWLKNAASVAVSGAIGINLILMFSWWVGRLPRDHTTWRSVINTLSSWW